MKNKKIILRTGVFFCIVIILIIPLLSSSALAVVTFQLSDAHTDNKPAGPSVYLNTGTFNSPGTYSISEDGSGSIDFICDAYIEDTKPAGMGSDHYVELNVQKVSPNPIGPLLSTAVWVPNLPANTRHTTYPVTLSISTNYTIGPTITETFNVSVYAECEDLQTSTKVWKTWYWDVVI